MMRQLLLLFVLLLALAAMGQHAEPAQTPSKPAQQEPAGHGEEIPPGSTGTEPGRQAAAEDPHAEFKESPSVKKLAGWTGMDVKSAYWLSVVVNFAVIAGLAFLLMRSRLPAMFRERTATIAKSVEEARRASEEANRRLAEVNGRLSRIDTEITALRAEAEREAAAEEARMRATLEEDRQKVVRTAEQEIAVAASAARADLRRYAAELAVSLAEKRIQVDAAADRALVGAFVEQLGRDGG